jgi:uncharacterized protein (TIGR03000 family)
LLAFPSFVAAQMPLSKWGNPVISIGQTPYYANDNGQGNFPGGRGYTPGYGYYPGNAIPGTTYPWLTGPDVPDYHRYPHGLPAAAPASPPLPAIDADAALLAVRVPFDAEIWIADAKTQQRGALRSFVTPPLERGAIFRYEIRARWNEAGRNVDRSKEITVRSGDRVTVDFTGEGKPLPPAPRQLNAP